MDGRDSRIRPTSFVGHRSGHRSGNGAETRQRGGQSKELRRAVGTGVAASSARVPSAEVPGAIPVFVVLACLGVALPIVTMFVRGVRTDVVLNERTTGLTCNNTTMTQINYRFSGTFPIGMDLDQV